MKPGNGITTETASEIKTPEALMAQHQNTLKEAQAGYERSQAEVNEQMKVVEAKTQVRETWKATILSLGGTVPQNGTHPVQRGPGRPKTIKAPVTSTTKAPRAPHGQVQEQVLGVIPKGKSNALGVADLVKAAAAQGKTLQPQQFSMA